MNLRTLATVVLVTTGVAVPALAASVAADGLVPVSSSQLDELYLAPGANLSGYRKVMIDPVPVGFHPYWLKHSYNRDIEVVAPVREDEINRIVNDAATSAYNGLVEAFRARGYEIVTAPGPGVLRLSPAVSDLYVNAPTRSTPYRTKSFTREPGDAMFRLEARDSVSGAVLGRVAHHGRATQISRLARADDVSNLFWLDTVLRRWAVNCANEFQAARQ
jgi:uncharacterized protein DUF3313